MLKIDVIGVLEKLPTSAWPYGGVDPITGVYPGLGPAPRLARPHGQPCV